MKNQFNANLAFISGMGLGAGLMYVLDPDRGRRRQALARDKVVRVLHELQDAADTTARDLAHRVQGTFAEAVGAVRYEQVDDDVLVQRVRSRMGRVVSHPSSIEVTAHDGRVRLSGPVLAHEADQLIDAVCRVRGVHDVENNLDVHRQAGDTPGLQGGSARPGDRWELMQANWAPATRFLVGTAGLLTLLYGARRGGVLSPLLGTAGAGLLARGATNIETRRLIGIGGRRAIDFQKTLHLDAPVEEVYRHWSKLENLPRIMSHVKEVKALPDGRYRWTVSGPAGAPVSWEAEITRQQENELIAWRSSPGSLVRNAGLVQFQSDGDGTRLHIRLTYNPPAGLVGHAIASLFGADPKSAMDDDLVRFKSLLEQGKTSADQGRVRREELAGD